MIKKILLSSSILFFLLLSGFGSISNEDIPAKLLGSWKYVAPTMGFKYQTGAIEFSYDEKVLNGVVILDDKILPMRNLIFENNKVRAYVMFEGQQFDIFLKFEMDSFRGTVSHPQGYLRISGNKVTS